MLLLSAGEIDEFWLRLLAENRDEIGCDCGSIEGALVGLKRFNGTLVGKSSSFKFDIVERVEETTKMLFGEGVVIVMAIESASG